MFTWNEYFIENEIRKDQMKKAELFRVLKSGRTGVSFLNLHLKSKDQAGDVPADFNFNAKCCLNLS